MDEADFYDEFGNYVGPVDGTEAEEEEEPIIDSLPHDDSEQYALDNVVSQERVTAAERQVVLHEDKKYYLSAMEVYGETVDVQVQEEDTQPLTEPIIAPIREILLDTAETAIPPLRHSADFLLALADTPERCRNVAVVGHIHHGKTSLVDCLVAAGHQSMPPRSRVSAKHEHAREQLPRYLDSLPIEQERGISLRAAPISLVVGDSTGCSHVLNLLDTPGHPDFREEAALGMGVLADGLVLVVDCVEGVQGETEVLLRAALALHRPVLLVLSKMERLWLELRLPPTDAYHKLKHTIDRLNTIAGRRLFAPECGNVCFASAAGGWAFSLASWARICAGNLDADALARRLWGDIYYSPARGVFSRTPSGEDATKRTFVTFCLEPLYKTYTHVLSARSIDELDDFLVEKLKVGHLRPTQLRQNARPLLRLALRRLFGGTEASGSPVQGLIDAMLLHLPAPAGRESTSPDGATTAAPSLVASICKVYPPRSMKTGGQAAALADQLTPRVLCRIWHGRVHRGQSIRIFPLGKLGEEEEALMGTVDHVAIPCTRYEIPVEHDTGAQWVLLGGLSLDSVTKRGTIVAGSVVAGPAAEMIVSTAAQTVEREMKLRSLLRVSIEPIVPSELPKMLHTLRLLGALYPSLATRVEESGEHVLLAPGELYLDCVLHDLRQLGQLQVRVSDPSVQFAETVQEMSLLKCFADTMNGRVRITMLAEPLEKGLAEAIESGGLSALPVPERIARLEREFGWDRVSARSVIAFAPAGGSVLLDDTFGARDELLSAVRASLVQGFHWAVREGPLCEEPIRGVKLRLLDVAPVDGHVLRPADLTPAQLVPACRRVCYSAFLTAAPRLLEPVNHVHITAPGGCIEAIYTCLAKRRGHVLSDTPLPATPLYSITALLPLLDAPGFEVDLRVATQGLAFATAHFDHWQPIPGDPLDTTLPSVLLEPAPVPALARDCLLKTRRRRGIGEQVRIDKFFDDPMLQVLAREKLLQAHPTAIETRV